jgi:hypothetical protein
MEQLAAFRVTLSAVKESLNDIRYMGLREVIMALVNVIDTSDVSGLRRAALENN